MYSRDFTQAIKISCGIFAPLTPRNGGDYSYFKVIAAHSGKALDVSGFSLDNGGNINQWTDLNGSNQHWYLQYASDGWFSICNRYSTLCLESAGSSISPGANIQQAPASRESAQLWRLMPEGVDLDFDAPGAPTGLQAEGQQESIRLDWRANTEVDLGGYTVLRAEALGGPYEIIARDLDVTSFIDHGVASATSYYYKLRASDRSLNQSEYSSEVVAASTGQPGLVAHLRLDGDTLDSTVNKNHGAVSGDLTYGAAEEGKASLDLNGIDQFVQMPATVVNYAELTIATWIFWEGGDAWQRIFDFGNDESEYMFLTPNTDSGAMRFAINGGEGEQYLEAFNFPAERWVHIALVFDSSGATLFLDGVPVDPGAPVTLTPIDISPVANFIGRSQFPDPTFNGRIDDFRVYNQGLSEEEVKQVINTGN